MRLRLYVRRKSYAASSSCSAFAQCSDRRMRQHAACAEQTANDHDQYTTDNACQCHTDIEVIVELEYRLCQQRGQQSYCLNALSSSMIVFFMTDIKSPSSGVFAHGVNTRLASPSACSCSTERGSGLASPIIHLALWVSSFYFNSAHCARSGRTSGSHMTLSKLML